MKMKNSDCKLFREVYLQPNARVSLPSGSEPAPEADHPAQGGGIDAHCKDCGAWRRINAWASAGQHADTFTPAVRSLGHTLTAICENLGLAPAYTEVRENKESTDSDFFFLTGLHNWTSQTVGKMVQTLRCQAGQILEYLQTVDRFDAQHAQSCPLASPIGPCKAEELQQEGRREEGEFGSQFAALQTQYEALRIK